MPRCKLCDWDFEETFDGQEICSDCLDEPLDTYIHPNNPAHPNNQPKKEEKKP